MIEYYITKQERSRREMLSAEVEITRDPTTWKYGYDQVIRASSVH